MIKKLFISMIALAFCQPMTSHGANYSSPDIITNKLNAVVGISAYDLETVLSDYVFSGDTEAMVEVFKTHWNPKTGEISFHDLLEVCVAGGITHCQQTPSDSRCKELEVYSIGNDQCMVFIKNLIDTAQSRIRLSKFRGQTRDFDKRTCKTIGGTWTKDITGSGHYCAGQDGKRLLFSDSCGTGFGTCVRDFASGVQVQEISGFELVKLWGQKHGLQLTCDPEYENRSDTIPGKVISATSETSTGKDTGQDFIRCSANEEAYEFEFDDLNESYDLDNYRGITAGLCALFELDRANGTGFGVCRTKDATLCQEINKSAERFGYTSSYNDIEGCIIKASSQVASGQPRTAFNINPWEFSDYINLAFTNETKNLVKDYVKTTLDGQNILLESFDCDAAYKDYGQNDNLWTCYVNSQPVDFVFDDLSEHSDQTIKSSISRMACEILGGIGTYENCHGLDEQQCITLGQKIQERGLAGTYYDREKGGCIIKEAETEHTKQLIAEVAIGVVVTTLTLGTGSPILVAVSIGGSIATDIAFEAVYDWQRSLPYEDYRDFINAILACSTDGSGNLSDAVRISQINTPENKKCLAKALNENYKLVVGQMTKLAPEDQNILTQTLANIANTLGTEDFMKLASESEISLIKSSRNYAGATLLAGTIIFNPEKMITKFDNIIINSAPEIRSLLGRFGKNPVLEPAHANSLGRDFYRITINDGDNVDQIINTLQGNGWYISATSATDGQKFLVASKENIFGNWSKSSSNWLSGVTDLTHANLESLIGRFGKTPYFISASSNRLGHDYYRILINDRDNVDQILNILQNNGWYVSAEMSNGQKYLAVSRKNIFGTMSNSSSNWLNNVMNSNKSTVKTGNTLIESLNRKNWTGYEHGGFYYIRTSNLSSSQHATGLKFHISVSSADLEKATDIVGNAAKRSGISGLFKVHLNPDNLNWKQSQAGKEFTVYVSPDGYSKSKIQQFINETERGLRNARIRQNGFGPNVNYGDKAVEGSQYMRYRYDRLDDYGNPQSGYREQYDFVAPNTQNGGDIMNGIRAY